MDKIKELLAQINAALAEMDTLVAEIEAGETAPEGETEAEKDERNKKLTAARAKYTSLETRVDCLRSKVEDLKKLNETRAFVASATAKLGVATRHAPRGGTNDGLSDDDLAKFSLYKALTDLRAGRPQSGIEAEICQEGQREARAAGTNYNDAGFMIPRSVLVQIRRRERRGMNATTAADGGVSVATEVHDSIFNIFGDKHVFGTLGATVWDNLQGNIDIPYLSEAIEATMTGETTQIAALTPKLDKKQLTPTRIGANVKLSNQLLRQNSVGVQSWATDLLMSAILAKFQKQVIAGGASDAIAGLLNLTGVELVDANGAAPTYANFTSLITGLEGTEADLARVAYLINSKILSFGLSTPTQAGGGKTIISEVPNADGTRMLAGYRAAVSNVMPSNGTAGEGDTAKTGLSSAIFGNWGDLILGNWGGVNLINDQYTAADTGETRIIVESFMDAAVIRPTSFKILKNAKC